MYTPGYSDTPQAREDSQSRQREIQELKLQKNKSRTDSFRNLGITSVAFLAVYVGSEILVRDNTYTNDMLNISQLALVAISSFKSIGPLTRFIKSSEKLGKLESMAGVTA